MPATSPIACIALLLATTASATAQSGFDAFQRGDYAAAKQLLSTDHSPRGRAFLALTEAATGRCPEAEPALLADYEDQNLRLLTTLAMSRCRIAQQRWAEAAALLTKLEEEFPRNPDVLYENARLHLKAWNGAVERIFESAPASFRVNQLSAEIFEIQGRYSEAVAEYRKALAKSPATLNLHYRLGRALLMESHAPESLEAARREFEAELELNPYDAVAEYQIAQIFEVQGNPGAARQRLESAVSNDPNFPEALVALGRALVAEKDYTRAVEMLSKAAELAPQSESAVYNLMLAYRNAGQRDRALEIKKRLDELQASPDGEFSSFLERIGEAPQQ